LAANRNNLLSF